VKLLLLTFVKNMSQLSVTTVYIKISYLQYAFKLSSMTVIFSAVCVWTVIEMYRVFSAAFVSINLY